MVSMDRRGPHLYTGSKYRGIRRSVWKNQGGGRNNPPSEDVLQKNTSGGRGLSFIQEFNVHFRFVFLCQIPRFRADRQAERNRASSNDRY